MRVLISGITGLIGSQLAQHLRADGHTVLGLSRSAAGRDDLIEWSPANGQLDPILIDGFDIVVHLAGESIAGRWTEQKKQRIRSSRIDGTSLLATTLARVERRPHLFISASAVGYYGDRPGELLAEGAQRGAGFLPKVVASWEGATAPADAATRVVHARTGLVLGDGGALAPLQLLTRLRLAGPLGSGRQHWPWIGLADEARALLHLATASSLDGPVNLAGPQRARSKDITVALASSLHRPHLLRLPEFVLKTAMGLAAQELLLADQAVEAHRLLEDGFVFETPTVIKALAAL